MNKYYKIILVPLAFLYLIPNAYSSVTLIDSSDWKVTMNGFVESDIVQDSTRSLGEIIGNSPIARSGTFSGDNSRSQFSDRNSRLGFAVFAPEQNGWKSRGVFELDFFGYNPVPATTTPKNTESSFYQNPVPRIRHAFISTESDGWQILTGQTWSLFGWQPFYFPTLLTVSPAPGELFQRNLQTFLMKTFNPFDGTRLQTAISLERPSQRDSAMPDLNVGVRYVFDNYRTGYASTSGDLKNEPLSIGISGSFRQFETPATVSNTSAQSHLNSSAYAIDALVPLITSSAENDLGNSLMLNAEYTSGTGYADSLPNWTGGLSGFPQGSASVAANTNLDAGFGGFDSNGNFDLVKLQTWNVSMQYVLPSYLKSFITFGYTSIHTSNISNFSASATSSSDIYDGSNMYFINFIHDFSKQIRFGVEYGKTQTHYVSDNATPYNDRYQLTALYRF